MTKSSPLAQMLDPLLQGLLHPDAAKLGKALKLLLGLFESRTVNNHAGTNGSRAFPSDSLFAFGTAYSRCIVSAHTYASVYSAVLLRSDKLLTDEPGSQSSYSKLCNLIVDEINRDLRDSHSILVAEADMIGLTDKERQDVGHVYQSGMFFAPAPDGFANMHASLRDFSPANVTNLILALATVIGEEA